MNSRHEKRTLPRLLCREFFSGSSMTVNDQVLQMIPVNFHREGMALTTHSPLPQAKSATVTFTFDNEFVLSALPVRIIHVHEIDVGCQYGTSFDLSLLSKETKDQLAVIEKRLSEQNDPADRYGLFS